MKIQFLATTLATCLAVSATPSMANDHSRPALAASMVGQFIAQQGNAALLQIRKELTADFRAALRPLLAERLAVRVEIATPATPTPAR